MKAAVIVAHPDDEIIWCGGLILQNPDWRWTVLSLSRADDPDRSVKFHDVCDLLNVTGLISDLDDGNPLKPISTRREIGHRIINHFALTRWDLCITHGRNGEYGHQRHKETHKEVLSLIDDGILDCGQLWTFAYECDSETCSCRPEAAADILIHLDVEELLEKKRIMCEDYGYAEDSFEARACISPEAFNRVEITQEE